MTTKREFTAGDVIQFPYPFVRGTFEEVDEDGVHVSECWKPGVLFGADGCGDFDSIAHGIGQQSLRVISVHKPGAFPTRIFYTRMWIDPDGRTFGKFGLRVLSIGPFRLLIRGYRHRVDRIEKPRPAI